MTKVYCPSVGCKHNKNERCRAKRISLKRRVVETADGMGVYWECENHEHSEEYKEMMRLFGGNVYGSNQKEEL